MTIPNYVCTSCWCKIETFFEGGCPPWPPQKKNVSHEKKIKFYFATDPQFLVYNLKVLFELRCLQNTRAQKIKNLPRYGGLKKYPSFPKNCLSK